MRQIRSRRSLRSSGQSQQPQEPIQTPTEVLKQAFLDYTSDNTIQKAFALGGVVNSLFERGEWSAIAPLVQSLREEGEVGVELAEQLQSIVEDCAQFEGVDPDRLEEFSRVSMFVLPLSFIDTAPQQVTLTTGQVALIEANLRESGLCEDNTELLFAHRLYTSQELVSATLGDVFSARVRLTQVLNQNESIDDAFAGMLRPADCGRIETELFDEKRVLRYLVGVYRAPAIDVTDHMLTRLMWLGDTSEEPDEEQNDLKSVTETFLITTGAQLAHSLNVDLDVGCPGYFYSNASDAIIDEIVDALTEVTEEMSANEMETDLVLTMSRHDSEPGVTSGQELRFVLRQVATQDIVASFRLVRWDGLEEDDIDDLLYYAVMQCGIGQILEADGPQMEATNAQWDEGLYPGVEKVTWRERSHFGGVPDIPEVVPDDRVLH